MAGNRNRTRFGGVVILPVAAATANQKPAVIFDATDNFAYFHGD